MSNIEPTEEQKQTAAAFVARHGEQNEVIDSGGQARLEWSPTHTVNDLARLLAEREAKLREEVARLEALCTEEARLIVERDTLRARVAELEASRDHPKTWAAVEEREAQHLADIKALREQVTAAERIIRHLRKSGSISAWSPLNPDYPTCDDVADWLAHYDAKDAEGGEG